MKKFLLQLHVYGGLFCAIQLLIFGISSLNMNHHFSFMQAHTAAVHWEKTISLPDIESPQPLAEAVRDSLGLFGWTPPWNFFQEADTFRFKVVHFGKEYQLQLLKSAGVVSVSETQKGFWPTFNSLHFLSENVPNAPWPINSWQYFQNFTVFFLFYSLCSGIYFWSRKKSERKIGITLLVLGTAGSLFYMMYLWLVG